MKNEQVDCFLSVIVLIIFALSISEKLPNPLLTVASIFKILVQILLINDVQSFAEIGC